MLSADLRNLHADVAAVAEGAALMYTRADCGHLARVLEDCARMAEAMEMGTVPEPEAVIARSAPQRVRLHVEDRMQDLLWLDVEDGVVVAANAQQSVWVGLRAAPIQYPHSTSEPWDIGDVVWLCRSDDEWRPLNYRVVAVEPVPTESDAQSATWDSLAEHITVSGTAARRGGTS